MAIGSMEQSAAIIELGGWLKTPPGRYLLAWEQERIDKAVVDLFGYHALQMGMPALDGLRANRMPHRWRATNGLAGCDDAPDDTDLPPAIATAPIGLHCNPEALPFP